MTTSTPAAAAPRYDNQKAADAVISALSQAKRPLVIAGAGVRTAGAAAAFWEFVEKNSLPVVTSMISVDLLPSDSPLNFGFIGAYGHRSANILTEKADVVLALGTRLDLRQTGANRGAFAPKSRLVRVDIDEGELAFQVKPDEEGFAADLKELLPLLNAMIWGKPQGSWRKIFLPSEETVFGHSGIEEFIPCILREGRVFPYPVKSSFSKALALSDGLYRLPASQETIRSGEEAEIWLW